MYSVDMKLRSRWCYWLGQWAVVIPGVMLGYKKWRRKLLAAHARRIAAPEFLVPKVTGAGLTRCQRAFPIDLNLAYKTRYRRCPILERMAILGPRGVLIAGRAAPIKD